MEKIVKKSAIEIISHGASGSSVWIDYLLNGTEQTVTLDEWDVKHLVPAQARISEQPSYFNPESGRIQWAERFMSIEEYLQGGTDDVVEVWRELEEEKLNENFQNPAA